MDSALAEVVTVSGAGPRAWSRLSFKESTDGMVPFYDRLPVVDYCDQPAS